MVVSDPDTIPLLGDGVEGRRAPNRAIAEDPAALWRREPRLWVER